MAFVCVLPMPVMPLLGIVPVVSALRMSATTAGDNVPPMFEQLASETMFGFELFEFERAPGAVFDDVIVTSPRAMTS